MRFAQMFRFHWPRRLLRSSLLALLLVSLFLGLSGAWWNLDSDAQPARKSSLAQGDAITDPTALLRYALPIDNSSVRQLQADIEGTSKYLRGKRWAPIQANLRDARFVLTIQRDNLLSSLRPDQQDNGAMLVETLTQTLKEMEAGVEAKDKEQVWTKRRELLDQLTVLETAMVQGYPFEVPQEYANLPQLKGRATVVLKTTQGDITVVADGYSAPINAGNFVDLVQRGFYDGLPFIRSDEFVVQSGNPPGPDEGFIDPKTGKYRSIPLEVLIKGEPLPLYGETLEEQGIYLADLALPFNAYGAIALARPSEDPNGGSSQFFFFKFDTELTPPGFNLMDGRYSVFGYTVSGQGVIGNLTEDDKIIEARVTAGLENLVEPS
ncbi:MAG: peptidylprolyl isomerase [Chloroflexaceae bacterium]|nr:peptidylprolyl isomerase [Chloroflexaceae bacterium]